MKKVYIVCHSILAAAIWLAPGNWLCRPGRRRSAIRRNAEAYVAAYNNHDAKAVAAMWSPDAVYMDPSTGEAAVGREEIEKVFAETLAESQGRQA